MASGRSAAVSFREIAGKIFPAKIVHISGALDPVSHMLLTELQVPNADGQLRPGMSAEIKFELPMAARRLLIPSSAVLARPEGSTVMSVLPMAARRLLIPSSAVLARPDGSTVMSDAENTIVFGG